MRRILIASGWLVLGMTSGCGVVAGIDDKEYVEPPTGKIVALSAGMWQTCAIKDGDVWCWGSEASKAWALAGRDPQRVDLEDERASSVSVGGVHACAVTESRRVFCWGYNSAGALGVDPATSDSPWSSPLPVDLDEPIRAVSSGAAHTCAVSTSGAVYCWGANYVGQVGFHPDPDNQDESWPCKPGYACALDVDSLKSSNRTWWKAPTKVAGIEDVHTISAVLHTTCALNSAGELYCWGSNCGSDDSGLPLGVNCERGGQLGIDPGAVWDLSAAFDAKPKLQNVPGLKVTAFGMSHATTFAIAPDPDSAGDNLVYGWGSNYYGQLGTGTCSDYEPIRELRAIRGASQIVSSEGNAQCVLLPESFWCWGENSYGELRTELSYSPWTSCRSNYHADKPCRDWYVPTPAKIPPAEGVLLALGSEHACIALPDLNNGVECWGMRSMLGPDTEACDGECTNACTESLRVELPQ